MKVLQLVGESSSRLAILVGEGLIGSAILNALLRQTSECVSLAKTSYRVDDLKPVFQALEAALKTLTADADIDWIWAAGRAGFGADQDEIARELAFFSAFVDHIGSAYGPRTRQFHLVSSAGGVYEGQSHITRDSLESPNRPYGHGKLRMESLVQERFQDHRIYRPTSVYGHIRPGRRMGLISAVVRNLLLHRVTHISGHADTLRDYVFANDIGQHICRRVVTSDTSSRGIELLGSGKPTALREIVHNIGAIVQRPPYVRYALGDNTSDITFQAGSLPTDWRPTPIPIGIREVIRDARQTFRHT